MSNLNQSEAQFHWAEGNRFGLEFCKSQFLFSSGLALALIAYQGATKSAAFGSSITIAVGLAILSIWGTAGGYFANRAYGTAAAQGSPLAWHTGRRIHAVVVAYLLVVAALFVAGVTELAVAFSR